MTARRIRGIWYVDFHFEHSDGQRERVRRRAPVQTKRDAVEYERQLRTELLDPKRRRKKEVPKFRDFVPEFLSTYVRNNNKPSERRTKEYRLRIYITPVLGNLRLDRIGVREIERFKAHLLDHEKEPSLKTQRNILAVLSKVLRYAEEVELIEKAPRVRFPRIPEVQFDFLDFDEAERLLESTGTHYPEWYAMVLTALRTGLRYGELCELRWDDVDLEAGRLLVRRSYVDGHVGTPKSGKRREVPLSPTTTRVLKAHRHLRSELVFTLEGGARITHKVAYAALHKLCRRAGLRKVGWHALRHTFASHLVMRNRSLKEVQELLGHADYQMTMRYAHLAPSVKWDAVATLDQPPGEPASRDVFGHYLGTGDRQDLQVRSIVGELKLRKRDSNPRPSG